MERGLPEVVAPVRKRGLRLITTSLSLNRGGEKEGLGWRNVQTYQRIMLGSLRYENMADPLTLTNQEKSFFSLGG